MPRKLTVVISQGQSANPAKRKLEEDVVAGLLFERGVEVTVVPNLYDLTPDGTGMLCLQGISGDMVVVSWLFSRAAFWTLDRNGIRGREGKVELVNEAEEDEDEDSDGDEAAAADDKPRVLASRDVPNRVIYCLDFKARNLAQPFIEEILRIKKLAEAQPVNILMNWIGGSPTPAQQVRFDAPTNTTSGVDAAGKLDGSSPAGAGPGIHLGLSNEAPADATPAAPTIIAEESNRRWYPVIDYARCTNCMECIDFCLFGVYGVDKVDTILVEQPDNCRKGCPACSRVCPENAIIFPQHKTPAIAGSPEGAAGAFKIDLSKLFGAPDALEQAVLERDVELVDAGRAAVGMAVGIPKRQTEKAAAPKDDLDKLMDSLDDLDL
ncbi:MAG: ferredoxin family protein [Planctomycetales bacterium]|nr:ferredoxin family protein [Planctomycetales bacterium]MBN8625494.1 ferredoxin family protein [Planctomycetota bacterium]